jgi:ABC-type polysaccharide/polyol phosphate transport system ATPase subunit
LGKRYPASHNGRARWLALARAIADRPQQLDHLALDAVDLEVATGEAVAIVGENGSGKSTLLKLIAGVLRPTSGVVTTRGRVCAMLELGAGFQPEFTGPAAAMPGWRPHWLVPARMKLSEFFRISSVLPISAKPLMSR